MSFTANQKAELRAKGLTARAKKYRTKGGHTRYELDGRKGKTLKQFNDWLDQAPAKKAAAKRARAPLTQKQKDARNAKRRAASYKKVSARARRRFGDNKDELSHFLDEYKGYPRATQNMSYDLGHTARTTFDADDFDGVVTWSKDVHKYDVKGWDAPATRKRAPARKGKKAAAKGKKKAAPKKKRAARKGGESDYVKFLKKYAAQKNISYGEAIAEASRTGAWDKAKRKKVQEEIGFEF